MSPHDDAESAADAAQRAELFYRFGGPVALVVLPFVANSLLFHPDRAALGLFALVLVVLIGVNAVFVRIRQTLPVPSILVALAAAAAVGSATKLLGMEGVVWTYSVLVMLHFLLARKAAVVVNLALVIATPLLLQPQAPLEASARVFATLLASVVFLNLFSSVVERLQGKLREAATTDFLTGAYNRRHLDKTVSDAIERRKRYGVQASLMLLDIDHFKRINDDLGHGTGDAVLRAVAHTIRTHLRKLDVLFRIGGEEFLVLLPDMGQDGATGAAEKLRAAIEQSPLCGDGRRVTVSVGLAELAESENMDSWIRRCDAALYQAKTRGRNCVVAAPS